MDMVVLFVSGYCVMIVVLVGCCHTVIFMPTPVVIWLSFLF